MAKPRRDIVTLTLHNDFYDKILQPARFDMEKRMGVKLSQHNFTKLLSRYNAKIVIPAAAFKASPVVRRRRSPFRI